MISEIEGRINTINQAAAEEEQRIVILNSVGDWNRFKDAISKASGPSLDESLLQDWQATIEWSEETRQIPSKRWRSYTNEQATEFLAWMNGSGGRVVVGEYQDAIDWLTPITRRDPVKIRSMIRSFNAFPRSNLFYVMHQGKRYYRRDKELARKAGRQFIRVNVLKDFNQNLEVISMKADVEVRRVPHEQVAEQVTTKLEKLRDKRATLETVHFDIIKLLLSKRSVADIESFVLLEWLYEVWSEGTQTSALLADLFADWGNDFEDTEVDFTVNWLWPDSKRDSADQGSKKLLAKLQAKFENVERMLKNKTRPRLKNKPLPRFRWAGVILSAEDGSPRIFPASLTGDLYAVQKKVDTLTLAKIGEGNVDSNKVSLSLESFGQGCPVFVNEK